MVSLVTMVAMVALMETRPFGDTGTVSERSNARVTFIGHATILIELDGVRLLTDPILRERVGPLIRTSGPPAQELWSDSDAVLISHSHWDHLDYGSLRLLGPGVMVVVPELTGSRKKERPPQTLSVMNAVASMSRPSSSS